MEPASGQVQSQESFDRTFSRELLKSEYRRSLLIAILAGIAVAMGIGVMTLGRGHFESIGDRGGSRYWLLLVGAGLAVYELACTRILARRIREGQHTPGGLGILNAVIEPTAITAWLLLEGLLFQPGAMFDSPLSYGYPVVVLLSSLQLSWRLCLVTSLVAAFEYMALVAWHWITLHGSLPLTATSYLPLHGVRALAFAFCGAAAAFVAYEIRKGIERTLQNLAERDFVVRVFGRYLTEEVVDEILHSPEGLRLGGKRRTVTVMISDLRGFTSLSESLSPEPVIAMLNHCLGAMTEVIVRYRGTIDEFLGDAILVIFGAPLTEEDDAERAVACAIEMQRAMEPVNLWNAQNGFPQLEMGIGLHTGPVVVGNIGSEKRSKYGVVGSTVNLASRIESYTVGGQVLVSSATASLLEGRLQVESRRTLHPKGFSEPIDVYDVRGLIGRHAVELPARQDDLTVLEQSLAVGFVLLEGKHAAGSTCDGKFTELSAKSAKLSTPEKLEPLSDLKIMLRHSDGEPVPGHVLAKVVDAWDAGFLLRFTAVEPGPSKFLEGILAAARPV